MPRALHPGRPGPDPFADPALTTVGTALAHALPSVCRIGTYTTTENPDPPYDSTTTFVATATGVACIAEPALDHRADVAGDPSSLATYGVKVPHGTALAVDQTLEVTAGRDVGLAVKVLEVHDSSTEPLRRATCQRITGGEA